MSAELTGPIIYKSRKQQIAYAAVLVPGEPDSDGEQLTAEKVEAVAHAWMEHYRNIDLRHSLNNVEAAPVESFITPEAMKVSVKGTETVLPKGTWVMATKVRDARVWKDIESGRLGGYSIMGIRNVSGMQALKSADSAAYKRTLLADLGEDWVAPFVSIVDTPAVPKAKWFALKSAAEANPELLATRQPSIWTRISEALKGSEPVSKSDHSTDNQEEAMDPAEVQSAIKEAVAEVVEPLTERLSTLETSVKEAADTADTGNDDGDATDTDAAEKSAEVEERLAALEEQLTAEKSAREEAESTLETFQTEVAEKMEEIERTGSVSKSLRGQDGDSTDEKREPHRDPFGRRLRKGA